MHTHSLLLQSTKTVQKQIICTSNCLRCGYTTQPSIIQNLLYKAFKDRITAELLANQEAKE